MNVQMKQTPTRVVRSPINDNAAGAERALKLLLAEADDVQVYRMRDGSTVVSCAMPTREADA